MKRYYDEHPQPKLLKKRCSVLQSTRPIKKYGQTTEEHSTLYDIIVEKISAHNKSETAKTRVNNNAV